MTIDAWVSDAGFTLDFPSDVDLSAFTQCRLVISKPDGNSKAFDFDQAVFQSVNVGGTLSYQVEPGDLTVKGNYLLQVFVKDATRDLALGEPTVLRVGERVSADIWNL